MSVTSLYRTYDPTYGRWNSEDPAGWEVGLNLYAYVNNSPMDSVDPFGLQSAPPIVVRPFCRQVDQELVSQRQQTHVERDWVFKGASIMEVGWRANSATIPMSRCNCLYKLGGVYEFTKTIYSWKVTLECCSGKQYEYAETAGPRRSHRVPQLESLEGITRNLPGRVVGNQCFCPPPPLGS